MKIKAVIIGFSHMHVNEIALYISEREDMELLAISDVPSSGAADLPPLRYTPGWNLQNVRERYCGKVYENYIEMLTQEKPDIAFILTENCRKPEVVEACAKRGIHVSIEKPIAVSLAEADRIQASVDRYGIEAMVNWPVVWRDYVRRMDAALACNLVGKPIKLRYINGHTGPLGKGAKHRGVTEFADEMTDAQRGKTWWHKEALGGGVFLDIACYGCFFSRWFMGRGARRVVSMGANLNTPFGDTDDNFVAAIQYDGRMSVIEGTWTTPRAVIPSGPMVLCTDGVIMCTGGAEHAPDVKAFDLYGNEVAIPNMPLAAHFEHMPSHYAHHVATGADLYHMLTLETNMEVMAMLDAVIQSAKSGKGEIVRDERIDC